MDCKKFECGYDLMFVLKNRILALKGLCCSSFSYDVVFYVYRDTLKFIDDYNDKFIKCFDIMYGNSCYFNSFMSSFKVFKFTECLNYVEYNNSIGDLCCFKF